MGVLGLLGFGSFTLASLIVGARLLALAARTRALPEAAFGTALFLGGVGYVLIVLGFRVVAPDHAPLPLAAGNLLLHVGSMALAIATWRVFRPAERWPAAAIAALASVLSVSFAIRLVHFDVIPPPASVFWTSTLAGRGGVCVECRRVVALLADDAPSRSAGPRRSRAHAALRALGPLRGVRRRHARREHRGPGASPARRMPPAWWSRVPRWVSSRRRVSGSRSSRAATRRRSPQPTLDRAVRALSERSSRLASWSGACYPLPRREASRPHRLVA